MFKIFKFIKESIQEGVEEGKAELRQEEEAKEAQVQHSLAVIATLSKNEILGSALAAPFRTSIGKEWFTVFKGDKASLSEGILPLHLFTFGDTLELNEEELKNIAQQQKISFQAETKEEVLSIARTFLLAIGLNLNCLANYEVLADWNFRTIQKDLDAILISATAVNLMNAADLKIISKAEVLAIFAEINPYVLENYQDWGAFAADFLAQEAILGWNKGLGRKELENEVNYLSYKWGSPWVRFPLNELS